MAEAAAAAAVAKMVQNWVSTRRSTCLQLPSTQKINCRRPPRNESRIYSFLFIHFPNQEAEKRKNSNNRKEEEEENRESEYIPGRKFGSRRRRNKNLFLFLPLHTLIPKKKWEKGGGRGKKEFHLQLNNGPLLSLLPSSSLLPL